MYHVERDELAHARWKSRRLLAVVSLVWSRRNQLLAGYMHYSLMQLNSSMF